MSRMLSNIPKNRKVYGNCRVLSPDNILMFKCDLKKINWYIRKGLCTLVDEDPMTIRLNFQPNGLGNHQKPFGLNIMKNNCVVCFTEHYLTKHHVVPSCYRKYLPLELKSHNHHDVLLLCVDCHEEYERHADELKTQLSIKYNSPINFEPNSEFKYRKIASILLSENEKIPSERMNELRDEIKEYYNIDNLTKCKLIELSKIKPHIIKPHGEKIMEETKHEKFMEMWREHFVEIMKPKYLPNNWNKR